MSFFGRSTYNLDDKNRLILPSTFRNQLDDGGWISMGFEECIVIYPTLEWEKYSSSIMSQNTSHADVRELYRYLVGNASEIQIDKQNRIKIPSDLIEETGISKECVILGVSNHIEIWSKEKWTIYNNKAKQRLSANAEKHNVGGF